jgi:hypothetical protein
LPAIASLLDFSSSQKAKVDGQIMMKVPIRIPSKFNKKTISELISYPALSLLVMLEVFKEELSEEKKNKIMELLKIMQTDM